MTDAAGAGVGVRLAAFLAPDPDRSAGGGEDDGAPDVGYRVEPDDPPGGLALRVVRNGRAVLRAATPDEVVERLRSEIDHEVALGSRTGLFVHAGVVGWRGHAILVPGRSMTGKSTLVAALVRQGATYYSDEYAVLAEDARVGPYARALVLRGDPPGAASARAGGPTGAAGQEPLPVALIVSTSYREGSAWRPEVVRGSRAVLPVIDNTVRARSEPERVMRLVGRLAPRVVTLRGPRPDADLAAPRILGFLDGLLDGRPPAPSPTARIVASGTVLAPVRPARYLRIEGFLAPEERRDLLEHAIRREAEFATSGVLGSDGTSTVDPAYRSSRTLFEVDPAFEALERRLRRALPYVRSELELPWFPVTRVERQLAAHQDGGFFGPHTDDGQEAVAGRRLTCVYYFHRTPRRFTGGELRLYDSVVRGGRLERAYTYTVVEPKDNSAVFFPSAQYHEVAPVRGEIDAFADSRFAVNVWIWAGRSPAWLAPDPAAGGS